MKGDRSYDGSIPISFDVQLQGSIDKKSGTVNLPSANSSDYVELMATPPLSIAMAKHGHGHHSSFTCNVTPVAATARSIQIIVHYSDGLPASCTVQASNRLISQDQCLNP